MLTESKKTIAILSVCFVIGLALLVAGGALGLSVLNTDVSLRNPATTTPRTLSTTTPQYLYYENLSSTTDGTYDWIATSTFETVGMDYVKLNIQYKGSTTDATLVWKYEFSDNYMEWYGEDRIVSFTSSTDDIVHSSSTVEHIWKPQVSSTVRKSVIISSIVSNYMRVMFHTENATGSVYATAALQKELNR